MRHRLFVLKRVDAVASQLSAGALPWGGWTPVNPYGMNRPTHGIPHDPKVLEAVHAFRSEADAWLFIFGVHADGDDAKSIEHRRAMRRAWKVVELEEVGN